MALALDITVINLIDTCPLNLQLSSGTTGEQQPELEDISYFSKEDWRTPSEQEIDILATPFSKSIRNEVTVVSIVPGIISQARTHILTPLSQSTLSLERDQHRSAAVLALREAITTHLKDVYGISLGQEGGADLSIHRPMLRSTAFNYFAKVYMGLHIDNRQKFIASERWKSRLLCSVNLGSTHRYFNFINLSTVGILTKLGIDATSTSLHPAQIKGLFCERYPDYPVVRIRIEPGQAYICNSEDIIHDGATNELGSPDVSLLILGDLL